MTPEANTTAQQSSVHFKSYKFVHYQPQAIECMSKTQDGKLVAVARANNSIEIWLR